ncbi:hypothetical protein OC846_000590 [Tilletia horrida]|uniref:T6SS Phospholipase effector Tle1-like catalytic domain-containing protein n=1 Tax=Tilletia horrida TaxID=155126 RepID=A0AAN6GWX2_9BASI|nr:hypothetical protein OC845_005642 [Tilletia horrida]KAK0557371.1 hypothetical protein OC846_000590 [Tilletia horrida]
MSSSTQRKKLVLALDGTFLARREALIRGTQVALGIEYLSNIALLAQAVKTHDQDGVPQVVYYQSGVGTSLGLISNLISGATGFGLLDNLIKAYSFLVTNFNEGDEIHIFGFSRGAFTARALSGFIAYAGIIKKSQLGFLAPIITAYMQRSPGNPGANRQAAEVYHKYTGLWPGADSIEHEREETCKMCAISSEQELAMHWTLMDGDQRVKPPTIKTIGVWDTVGSLGIPGLFNLPAISRRFQFFDVTLSPNVQNAFHALALQENRADFSPTLWKAQDKKTHQTVKQVWFTGSHPDIGGGFYEHGLSDITLAWMVAQLQDAPGGPSLSFDLDFIKRTQDRTRSWARQPPHATRLPFTFRHERQVLAIAPPEERSEAESVPYSGDEGSGKTRSMEGRGEGVKLQASEPTNESIHYSVTIGSSIRPNLSEQFRTLRYRNPSLLRKLWAEAESPESLLPTERELLWTDVDLKLQPLSIGYGGIYGLIPVSLTTRFQALLDIFGALFNALLIVLSYFTNIPARIISFFFSLSFSAENLLGVPPENAPMEVRRDILKARLAWDALWWPESRATEVCVEPILLAQK